MILEPLMQYADAIVMAWLPGIEGAGVTDVLFGDVRPSGKLPFTWPRSPPPGGRSGLAERAASTVPEQGL